MKNTKHKLIFIKCKKYKNIESQMFNEDNKNKNRAMFTEETTIKLLGDLKKQNINLEM